MRVCALFTLALLASKKAAELLYAFPLSISSEAAMSPLATSAAGLSPSMRYRLKPRNVFMSTSMTPLLNESDEEEEEADRSAAAAAVCPGVICFADSDEVK